MAQHEHPVARGAGGGQGEGRGPLPEHECSMTDAEYEEYRKWYAARYPDSLLRPSDL